MAITAAQIDQTLATAGSNLSQLAIQVQSFEQIFAALPAGAKTGVKQFVSTQLAAIQSSLTDVQNAINALP